MAISNKSLWDAFDIGVGATRQAERELVDYELARAAHDQEQYERALRVKALLPGVHAVKAQMLEEQARREARTVNTKTIKHPMLTAPLSAVVNQWRMRFEDWMRESDIEGLDAEWALAYVRLQANNKFEMLDHFFRLKEDA